MGLGVTRQRLGEGAQRGELTGPNPTDRGKLGTKRHVITDGRGVVLGVTLTGANVHDKWMVGQTLDAVVVRALRIRWETKATHSMALVHLACALIAYRAATRRNGHQF